MNSTVSRASPRAPMGISLAMLIVWGKLIGES